MKKALDKIILVLVIILLGYYIFKNQEVLSSLRNLNFYNIIVLVFLQASMLVLMGLSSGIMIKRFNQNVKLTTVILLQFVNNAFNNIVPQGGVGYRAIIYKNYFKIPYLQFFPTLAASFILNLIISCIFALGSFIFFYLQENRFDIVLIALYLLALVCSLFILISKPNISKSDNKLIDRVRVIIQGWDVIREHTIDIYLIFGLAISNLLVKGWQMYLVYQMLGENVSYIEMIYLSTITLALQVINITPGNIGIREGAYAFSSQILSIPANMLVLGSLVQRAIQIITATFLGGTVYIIFSRRLRNK